MFQKIDLRTKLEEQRDERGATNFLEFVQGVLRHNASIDKTYSGVDESKTAGLLSETHLDPEKIFELHTIRSICIKFGLRFLSMELLKEQLPKEALEKIQSLKRHHSMQQLDLMVLAPPRKFKLGDSDGDPLLFARTENGNFFLVHKWGNDLTWYRAAIHWPFRSPINLICSLILFVLALTVLVPDHLITTEMNSNFFSIYRAIFFVWALMVSASFLAFAWFAFFGKFSSHSWNDRCFN